MPLNPTIALSGSADLSGPLQGFRNALINIREQERRDKQAELEQQLQPLRERLLQAQVATAEAGLPTQQQLTNKAQQARIQSVIQGSMEIQAPLAAGDIEGVRSILMRRKSALQQQNIPTNDTDEALQLLESDPQLLLQRTNQAVQLGQQLQQQQRPSFQKGQGVLIEQDGQQGIATTVFDPLSGTTKVDFAPISGQIVTPTGETPEEKSARLAREAGKKEEAKLEARMKLEPNVKAAVELATASAKAEVERAQGQRSNNTAFSVYNTAMSGLVGALGETVTGPIVGWSPALTSNQQIADGAVAAMAPVLKQMFRSAGEGTFTDKDQELLLKMVPTRRDKPDAITAKLANIDAIVKAKLGQTQQAQQLEQPRVIRFDEQGNIIQ